MTQDASRVLELFAQLTRIPRCSGNEAAAARHVTAWAEARQLPAVTDRTGNVLVRVPSAARRQSPCVVLQAHLDMVCEAVPGSRHDFERDPIALVSDGEWLVARETTLGADNGLGCALMMAAAEAAPLRRPPLELLFTVAEETGLEGARALEPDLLRGRILLNLDSEHEGVFTVGCAGGRDCTMDLRLGRMPSAPGTAGVRISVGGLKGGHSGVDIHRGRANANLLLAELLSRLLRTPGVAVAEVNGGTARNAIARDAHAVLSVPAGSSARVEEQARTWETEARGSWGSREPSLSVTVSRCDPPGLVLEPSDAERYLRLSGELPHGVQGMSERFDDLVETSGNLAVVRTTETGIRVAVSLRSSRHAALEELARRVTKTARRHGAGASLSEGYSAWEPDPDSPLVRRCAGVYRDLFGEEPSVRAIHAGLECAVIGRRYEGMQMISLGPTIEGAHAPGERVHRGSVERVWRLLTAVLEDLARQDLAAPRETRRPPGRRASRSVRPGG